MAESADLQSIQVLRDVRAAFCSFIDDAKNALADVDFEIRRMREWLSNEQRLYWQAEIRRWQQNLSMARTELHRKKLGKFLDHRPDTTQEEKAVRQAQARLENAEQKLETVRRWVPELQHAVQEYRGSSQPLASMVDVELQRALGRLDRMLEALEAYLQIEVPQTPAARTAGAASLETMARPAAGYPPLVNESPAEETADERERGLEQAEPRHVGAEGEVGPDRA
jgi:DNA-binding transcriptional MerR regulator